MIKKRLFSVAYMFGLTFFFTAFVVATVLFLAWGIRWGGLPEFSEVGIID